MWVAINPALALPRKWWVSDWHKRPMNRASFRQPTTFCSMSVGTIPIWLVKWSILVVTTSSESTKRDWFGTAHVFHLSTWGLSENRLKISRATLTFSKTWPWRGAEHVGEVTLAPGATLAFRIGADLFVVEPELLCQFFTATGWRFGVVSASDSGLHIWGLLGWVHGESQGLVLIHF